jgi:hypothetical protein
MAKKPLLAFDRGVPWNNKHLTAKVTPERLYTVANKWEDGTTTPLGTRFVPGLRALQQIVRDAQAAGKRVRAFGGGWSLSRIAMTEEFLVNTRLLNYINIGLKAENVAPTAGIDRRHLVFAQCGTTIMELNRELELRGLSLATSGASNGQTICGATSTGTHGSNRKVGAMHDMVVGIHVIAQDGVGFWIERASRPVVTRNFATALGATLKRDDNLFNAAVVGLGCFGLVHGVLLQVRPLFTLERHVKRFDFGQVRPVMSTLDVAPLRLANPSTAPALRGGAAARVPDHFEIVLNPYGTKRGERGAAVRYMYEEAAPPPGQTLSGGVSRGLGDDVMGLMGHVTTVVPALVPTIASHAIDQIAEGGPVRRSLGHMFDATTTEGFVMSTEIGVALADASNAVDAIVSVAGTHPWPGLVALRYVKASPAHLAFTRFAPVTCTIELPSSGAPRTLEAFEHIWDELERRRIAYTLHWGQQLRYDPARVKAAFGARATQWLNARRAFLSPAARRTFSNALIDTAGLSA